MKVFKGDEMATEGKMEEEDSEFKPSIAACEAVQGEDNTFYPKPHCLGILNAFFVKM
jgi:hypothetical protein